MLFIIPGEPIAKKRPRAARRGLAITVYDCQKKETEHMRQQLKQQLAAYQSAPNAELAQEATLLPHYEYYDVSIFSYHTPPKKWLKSKIKKFYKNTKFDIDNIIKQIFDAGNGILWKDDAKICRIYAEKRYSENPRTEIFVKELIE